MNNKMPAIADEKYLAPIRKKIMDWFKKASRHLPWRDDPTPYKIWVSEIMAQQTRIDTVTPYFNRFLKRFPTVDKLAKAPIDRVLEVWSGLGYYARARNLHKTAGIVVTQLGGMFPDDPESLMKLPGIGPYTAGAIASIAFDKPAPILDGNVIRVLTRLFDISTNIGDSVTKKQLWSLSGALAAKASPSDFNQGLMELGALVCTPKNPQCNLCPVHKNCRSLSAGTVEERPVRMARSPVPICRLAGAVSLNESGELLMVQNELSGLFGGLWQIPIAPFDLTCTHSATKADLANLIKTRLGKKAQIGRKIGMMEHILTHRKLRITVYEIKIVGSPLSHRGYRRWAWVNIASADKLPAMGTLMIKVLAVIAASVHTS